MPLHQSPRRVREEAVTHRQCSDSLWIKDAVPGRYNARDIKSIGLSWPVGSPGAPASSEPHAVSWRICAGWPSAQQCMETASNSGRTRAAISHGAPRGCGQDAGRAARRQGLPHFIGYDMGAAVEKVFGIDISVCEQCGGTVRVVACIEDSDVVRRILNHLAGVGRQGDLAKPGRGPPQCDLFV